MPRPKVPVCSNPSGVGFQTPSLPKESVGIGPGCRGKDRMKSMPRGTPPNHPKSTGPENIGPERTDFGCIGIGAVGSLAATTLENNEKFRPTRTSGERVVSGGWRRDRDSNPGWGHPHNGFRDRPVRPLRHPPLIAATHRRGGAEAQGVMAAPRRGRRSREGWRERPRRGRGRPRSGGRRRCGRRPPPAPRPGSRPASGRRGRCRRAGCRG